MKPKPFYLNPDYSLNYLGDVWFRNKFLPIDENINSITIPLGNENHTFDRKWLGLICHFNVKFELPELLKIDFIDCDSKLLRPRCGKFMIIKDKINLINRNFTEKFQPIPGYTDYLVDRNGNVLSTVSGRILPHEKNAYGYPCVHIYNNDASAWRHVGVHLVLARTYIKNTDPNKYHCVNHKDGDKENFSLSNLEWVTSLENNLHAIGNGLRTDNSPCEIRNIETGEILEFPSLSAGFKSLGYSSIDNGFYNVYKHGSKPKLYCGKYEIRKKEDKVDWYYKVKVQKKKFCKFGPFYALRLESKKNNLCRHYNRFI